MANDGVTAAVSAAQKQPQQMVVQGGTNGFVARAGKGVNKGLFPTSFKALSSYLRIVSSGASTVVKSAASAASAIVERESESGFDQVHWAGFDKLEFEGGISRRVLLLAYRYGFQVWDVEETDNVNTLVSRYDGPVSFMQILPTPVVSKQSADKFAENRPLMMICADGSFLGGGILGGGSSEKYNGTVQPCPETVNGCFVPTVIWFYSLKSRSYIHLLKFRTVVHTVRCSSRVVAVLQASQIHCFGAATLEREYTILTNPVVTASPGSGGVGVGPLAVGPRWMAYSGRPVVVSNPARVSAELSNPYASFPSAASNGSLVAHYAKESSKHLAAGIVTLGDMGYKKLSRYCSELLPDGNNSQPGSARVRLQGMGNGHSTDADNIGMVIVRDSVSKTVVAQFRAHKSPISSLCFDPSGTLLVTASVQGHNVNVFRILPGLSCSAGADPGSSYVHLYRLQRGFTNAVIQDVSFSNDSQWVLVNSSRGTSHLFAISPSGGPVSYHSIDASFSDKNGGSYQMAKHMPRGHVNLGLQVLYQQNICASGPPITLSVASRIRSGGSGWRSSVSGAAAVATGKINSVSGAIASAFRYCSGDDMHSDTIFFKRNYHLLILSPSGCLIQYAMRGHLGLDSMSTLSRLDAMYGPGFESEERIFVEAIQKWNIFQKPNHKERENNIDIYGASGSDSSKVFPEGMEEKAGGYSASKCTITKQKLSSEERRHLYMSEAELQTHQARMPLWAKSEIYFQSMVWNGINIDSDGGEVEIETALTHTIDVRSKDLAPAYDYFQSPRFQQGRNNGNGLVLRPRSDVSEKTSSESLDSISNIGTVVTELYNCTGETGMVGLAMPTEEVKGFVKNTDSITENTRFETVNKESSMTETQSELVNNNICALKMENRDDLFD